MLLGASALHAQDHTPGPTASGLCGVVYTGAPRCRPGWTLSGTGGYGVTELRGTHHRALGVLGLAYTPLAASWLSVSLEFQGRIDVHPADEHGGKHASATGDPWLHLRGGWQLPRRVSLGGEIGLWLPGNTAPSYSPSATTVDIKALLSWLDASQNWTLLGSLGVRIDNSANSAPDTERLRYGDLIALGLSDSSALLLGLGVVRRIQAVQVFGELSAQLLLGSQAPPLLQSPLRAAVGARYFFSDPLSVELSVVPVFSQRPNTAPDAPLVPIEPRVSVLAGVRYQFLTKPKPAPVQAQVVKDPNAVDEPPSIAAIRGSLTDEAGAPLPDATVLLNPADGEQQESVSQGDGSYVFESIKPGKATLSVSAPGFDALMLEVDVVAPLTRVPGQKLSAASVTGNLRCFVRSFSSQPLKANIVVRDARGRKVASGSSDEAGLWEYPLPPGDYKVVIEAPGYKSRRSNIRVAPNEVAVLNIDLREE
ncbi:MAG TPA: carboxypeptidase-like regulatory domain-containing protein [Polyangiales bacterium]